MENPTLLWTPSQALQEQSNLQHFLVWLNTQKGLSFENYDALWQWSVQDVPGFWQAIWDYFEIVSHSGYSTVLEDHPMPNQRWFPGATLNYAAHVFRQKTADYPALFFASETDPLQALSWEELELQVAAFAAFLRSKGVEKGDRVAAFLPTIPETTVAFLATVAIGAVWSCCSPDFGARSVIERFQQIEPKVLIAIDGYRYGGKTFDRMEVVQELIAALPGLSALVFLPALQPGRTAPSFAQTFYWQDIQTRFRGAPLVVEPLPFDHPIWILYSSGTTGIPKAITHGHGGVLLEHLKYLVLQNDVKPGERYFWFTTTGWMMWNFLQAALLGGASVVLYDGSPAYPDLQALWKLVDQADIQHFGTSAPFLMACLKEGLEPGKIADLSRLRSIGSTGSPLPPEAFDWVYAAVKSDVWLNSMSGGTDICTAWVGASPLLPVYKGEIQCRCLGAALFAYDDQGQALIGEVGEMVLTRPMPSMPIFFWNDPDNERYRESYFEWMPGVWRHGDWVRISERGTLSILGRSDATLNRQGIRIGTAEIYRSLNQIEELVDALIMSIELPGGHYYMPLFVVLQEGTDVNEALRQKIRHQLRMDYSPRHVPDEILEVPDIPYTISGKKLETPVKRLLMGVPPEKAVNMGSLRNAKALDFFIAFRQKIAALENPQST
ncbi:MAG: acetoacetate--CoA ligase [Saprospiraceae bacterium]|nr:acetoacetate--CoA ligase [Saprospiraceae bacterium]MDP4997572.1 acetoacetate--CoA ligase [Saprospiraceae bacterium]